MNEDSYRKIVLNKPWLFWGVGNKSGLSDRAVVEAVLGCGDMQDFAALKECLGEKRVAEIFYRISEKPRCNLSKKTINFWNLYFQRHEPPGT